MAKDSKIMICKNIKLDKNYQNVLTYTEQQMLTLCTNNRVAYSNEFSFINPTDNSIRVPFSYSDCLTCNYMAFQNYRYSNKWFFAFIDEVQYVSDGACNIKFTVDVFATWFDYWTPKSCFVVREHTMDDTVGSNTIPEGLETGDFIAQSITPIFSPASSVYTVIGVSEIIDGIKNLIPSGIDPYYSVYGGIYSGIKYIIFDNYDQVSNFIRVYENESKKDAIYSIFIIPTILVQHYNWVTVTYTPLSLNLKFGLIYDSDEYLDLHTTPNINSPTQIDGYTPKNNKLFIGDYNYLLVSNNMGQDYIYKYEDFVTNVAKFKVVGTICIGGSIKAIPMNYKELVDDEAESMYSWPYGITIGKYPTCSWITDPYVNWLTQNSVNIMGHEFRNPNQELGILSAFTGSLLMVSGIGAGIGAGMLAGGAMSVFNSLQQNYQHDKVPLQAQGSVGTGDITYSAGHLYVPAYKMTIRQQYARSIDEFFTRFGYKTNRLKLPNQTGRRYFNYVEIGKSEIIGYPNNKGCPADVMEDINNIYRSGITLWHDHSRIGNYDDNTIVQ